MSKEALAKVVQRAISDAAFRRQLSTDPAGALRGFSLTADETAAVRGGDPGRLSALGIDQRMSKVFVLGTTASNMAVSDVSGGSPNLISSGTDGGVLGSVDQDGANASSSALVSGDASSDGNLIDAGVTGGGPAIISPLDPANVMADEPGDLNVLTAADAGTSLSSGVPTATTYSGDDIAGPGYGADAGGGATPTVEPGDSPNITP